MNYVLKYFLSLSVLLSIFIFSNCSPSRQIIEKENIFPEKYFENTENISFNINDERKYDPNAIFSYDGINNFYFKTKISKYIEEYFNKSLLTDSLNTHTKVINTFIDQLKFEADKSIKYSIRFFIPTRNDSFIVFRVASKYKQTKNSNRDYLSDINCALSECLNSFFVQSKDLDNRIIVIRNKNNLKNKSDSLNVDSSNNIKNTSNKIISDNSETITAVEIGNVYEKKIKTHSLSVLYNMGNNVESGIQTTYNIWLSTDKQFFYGYGIGLLYYKINNVSDGFNGFLISAALPLSIEYYLSEDEISAYFGASIKLTYGNEKIDYGGYEKSSFFFGPTIEPYIGLKLFHNFSIDVGPYFLAFLGSKMLPNDFGARFNFNIWFK